MKIGFIGTGNMGGALAGAASRNSENKLLLANRHPEKAKALAEKIGGEVKDNRTVARESDFIFLGIKPFAADGVLDEIKDVLAAREKGFALVSMIAGRPGQSVLDTLGGNYPIIRIMPNIPVSVGEGVILFCTNSLVTEEMKSQFLRAMDQAGKFIETDEKLIDAGSAVSGCGPAFAAIFIEALADGGVACGMPRKTALECAAMMVKGTAQYILETGTHPAQLKDAVCSPGGTTIQGVRALEENNFRAAVMNSVIEAYQKTLNLK